MNRYGENAFQKASRYMFVVVVLAGFVTLSAAAAMQSLPDTDPEANVSIESEAGAQQQVAASPAQPMSSTGCFRGKGHQFRIGESPGTIDSAIHLSVLTNPADGSEFGLESVGDLEQGRVVTLAAGVRVSGSDVIESGGNPFAGFDLIYRYELDLPMFDGRVNQSTYSDDRPPVESGVGVVDC